MNNLLRKSVDILDWETSLKVLSMERVEPFLAEMGLELRDVKAVRAVARALLDQFEQLQEQYSQPPDDSGVLPEDEVLVQRILVRLAEVTDEETAQYLSRWITQHSDRPREYSWKRLLYWLVRGGKATPPALPEDKMAAIVESVEFYLGDSYDLQQDRIDEAESLPRSEWEERIYRTYAPGCSPLDEAWKTIGLQRFRTVWKKINSLLNSEEMEIVLQWGKSQAPRLGISPESLELPVDDDS